MLLRGQAQYSNVNHFCFITIEEVFLTPPLPFRLLLRGHSQSSNVNHCGFIAIEEVISLNGAP